MTPILPRGATGAVLCSWLGYEHAPPCRAIHINILTMRHPDGPQSPEEEPWAATLCRRTDHAGRLPDPAGDQAADAQLRDDGQPCGCCRVDPRKKCTAGPTRKTTMSRATTPRTSCSPNIMVYLVTGTFDSASWIYFGRREEGGRILSPEGRRVEVPTGCALFPRELLHGRRAAMRSGSTM